jgi:transposase InsO family protein
VGDGRAHALGARRSDQGAQYVALGFGQQARDAGIAVSMGSKGDAYDNAVAESFFATIKRELVHRQVDIPMRRYVGRAACDWRHHRHDVARCARGCLA